MFNVIVINVKKLLFKTLKFLKYIFAYKRLFNCDTLLQF